MAICINGHVLYNNDDVYRMLANLSEIDVCFREEIYAYIWQNEMGMDRVALLNIVRDPVEYNLDYLDRFDSDVGEKFIQYMEYFGLT